MMKIVKAVHILITTEEGQELTNLIYLENGKIINCELQESQISSELKLILQTGEASEKFLASLQTKYSGSYFRATELRDTKIDCGFV